MPPYLRSQARSAAFGPSVAALRPASGERIQALQAVFEEAVPAGKTSSKSNRSAQQHTSASAEAHEDDLIDMNSQIESSSNSTNMVGEHTLDHPMEMYGQILVDMSKSTEDNIKSATTIEEPVIHEPTTWLSIPNELKDMVIEQYILAIIADKSTRPRDKGCGGSNPPQLHLHPGEFAIWAKQENYKLGVLRASMDLRNAAKRIIDNLAAEKKNEFREIQRPWACGNPSCCRYWTDAAFEKSRLLSLRAFCHGKKAWKVWAEDTE